MEKDCCRFMEGKVSVVEVGYTIEIMFYYGKWAMKWTSVMMFYFVYKIFENLVCIYNATYCVRYSRAGESLWSSIAISPCRFITPLANKCRRRWSDTQATVVEIRLLDIIPYSRLHLFDLIE